MKLTKATLLVIAGVLLAGVLFSFKNDQPQKEYLSVFNAGGKFVIIYPDGTQKETKTISPVGPTERTKVVNDFNSILNEVAKNGWALTKSYDMKTAGDVLFIFERTKP